MNDQEREEFQKRFIQRRNIFTNAIQNIDSGFNEFEWHLYLDRDILKDDGNILCVAELKSKVPNLNKEELIKYACFVIDQGFNAEVVFEYEFNKVIAHIVSWENEQFPDWPESVTPAVTLTWEPVSFENKLGMET